MNDLHAMVAAQKLERELSERMHAVMQDLQESAGWSPVGSLSRDAANESPLLPLLNRFSTFRGVRTSRIYDRQDGRYMPYYENEWDLKEIRQACRNIAGFSSIAIGAVETLDTFVVSEGFTFTVKAADESQTQAVQPLVDHIQAVVDKFLDQNDFRGSLDSEAHMSLREEGETILAVKPQTGMVARIITIDPDELTEPRNAHAINQWLGIDDDRSFWEFGIHTRYNPELNKHDTEMPLHYHVVYDESGSEYDVIPASQVVHLKSNVPRKAKRGVSDFLAPLPNIEMESKLGNNLGHGMNILACIPFVKELAEGRAFGGIPSGADGSIRNLPKFTGSGSRNTQRYKFNPGTIPTIEGGKYQPGPLAGSSAVPVMETLKYLVNRMGAFWSIPSFMLLGDTETALYSAVLAIGSPFVRRRQREQQQLGEAFTELIWKALKIAWETGQISSLGSWQEIERTIDITFEATKVALTDDKERAETQKIEIENGTLSRKTAAEEAGHDPAEQAANIAAEEDTTDDTTLDPQEQEVAEAFNLAQSDPAKAANLLLESWKVYP
ncbi:phage portal family protein [Rubinisphaera brasiliensis]|uniref:Phage portal protein, lambda family n=1 Tax=Rubinisphaera brasiliensis (strain ATCC 49424 / DSM 5305 / JCM 21570 / IAM 15109 / NBRC 103401 / IFAM 1448) TaxID=756272 RepID=F0SNL3_RUBBR|nr:phage portal protein [Rubinisphaera brasiliensis]ADY57847.1 hypothetical protein Plabr_0218 [Rubinisphaera brasiliensis DSM 5305]